MPGRSPRERWRYIAFAISSDRMIQRGEFLNALMVASRGTPLEGTFRITVFEGDFGILKVSHTLKDDAIRLLRAVNQIKGSGCTVETLKTSGTIKTLKEKFRHRLGSRPSERG